MIDFYFESDYDDFKIKGVERGRKVDAKRKRMILNGAGLKTVTLPVLAKKAEEVRKKKEN